MDLSRLFELISDAGHVSDTVKRVTLLVEAGAELAHIVRSNVEAAAATLSEADAAKLREHAAALAETNRTLSADLDRALGA